jgi:hypothetical protein
VQLFHIVSFSYSSASSTTIIASFDCAAARSRRLHTQQRFGAKAENLFKADGHFSRDAGITVEEVTHRPARYVQLLRREGEV